MGLFGALYVGTSGLQTSQEALNVVAHNITNVDTEGYVRQQVSEVTRNYNKLSVDITGVAQKQAGLGVTIAEVRQVRDRFLDQSYREEYGRQGFYDTSYAAIEEIEEILGELDGATFYESLNDLWTSVEELVKDPNSEVCQSMLVQYAQSFTEAASNVYKDLENYQDKLDYNVRKIVDDINEKSWKIYKLNEKIRGIEAGGVENANDLKDQRNQLLDELSKLGRIEYREDFYGNVLVKFEGHDLVLMDKVNEMACAVDEGTGFSKCFWPDIAKNERDQFGNKIYDADTAPVFNFDIPISAAADTDLGTLKATVLARGDHRANWTDLETGSGYDAIKESVMMNVMAEFDGLVRNVATSVNDVIRQAAEAATKLNPASTYMRDTDGNPIQIFTRIATLDTVEPDKFSKDVISSATHTVDKLNGIDTYEFTDEYGYSYLAKKTKDEDNNFFYKITRTDNRPNVGTGEKVEFEGRYNLDADGNMIGDSTTWFSAVNLNVNQDLLQYPTHLGFVMPDGSVDYETAKNLENAFKDEKFILNPDLTNAISITNYYSNLVAQCSNSGNVYKSLKENQELTVNSIESTRQGNIGVATDEELSNMIKYQNAYNASSRYINVIDECMEHIINTLGT